jgi:hypothetical protein
MKTDTASFILQKYRPLGMILQDPRNMHLDDIRKVLQLCYGLQTESGPESAFRFEVFFGPKRKRLYALYPVGPNIRISEPEQNGRKKKEKGKQKEDTFQGLLRIDESEEPPATAHTQIDNRITSPSRAGPSNDRIRNLPEPQPETHQNDLVRIDMGQMLQLKNMGYEGYPEYEVPKALLDLISHTRPQHYQNTNDPDVPAPIYDPALLDQDSVPFEQQINDHSHDDTTILQGNNQTPMDINRNVGQQPQPTITTVGPPHSSGTNVHPTGPPNNDADPDSNTQDIGDHHQPLTVNNKQLPGANIRPTTPSNINIANPDTNTQDPTHKKQLGKRAQANLSPQSARQTGAASKKKKVTDDDLAAIEAQKMVQSGSRRRTKPTWRKG